MTGGGCGGGAERTGIACCALSTPPDMNVPHYPVWVFCLLRWGISLVARSVVNCPFLCDLHKLPLPVPGRLDCGLQLPQCTALCTPGKLLFSWHSPSWPGQFRCRVFFVTRRATVSTTHGVRDVAVSPHTSGTSRVRQPNSQRHQSTEDDVCDDSSESTLATFCRAAFSAPCAAPRLPGVSASASATGASLSCLRGDSTASSPLFCGDSASGGVSFPAEPRATWMRPGNHAAPAAASLAVAAVASRWKSARPDAPLARGGVSTAGAGAAGGDAPEGGSSSPSSSLYPTSPADATARVKPQRGCSISRRRVATSGTKKGADQEPGRDRTVKTELWCNGIV